MPAAADAQLDRMQWKASVPFWLVHVVAAVTPFVTGLRWEWVALAAASYAVRMFGITAGYHRYFSHRAYRTSRAFQFLLAVLGTLTVQKGALWWAAHHRDHHRHSDAEEDVHSPVRRGFWWSHVGWILSERHDRTKLDRVRDLARYPELVWLDRWGLVLTVAWAAGFFLAGGLPALLWGFFVPVAVSWHVTFCINSLAHVVGTQRYPTGDDSRNNPVLALLTFGEGWHNNHHFYPSAANQGWFWWELDLTWYALRLLAAMGVVWDLRTPPTRVRRGILVDPGEAPLPDPVRVEA